MKASEVRPFCDWIRDLVARVVARDGLTRQEVADRLGVHLQSITTAAYRGGVGCELAMRLADLAGAGPTEKAAIELAWLKSKAGTRRDDAFRRAIRLLEANSKEVSSLVTWLEETGNWERFSAWRGAAEDRNLVS